MCLGSGNASGSHDHRKLEEGKHFLLRILPLLLQWSGITYKLAGDAHTFGVVAFSGGTWQSEMLAHLAQVKGHTPFLVGFIRLLTRDHTLYLQCSCNSFSGGVLQRSRPLAVELPPTHPAVVQRKWPLTLGCQGSQTVELVGLCSVHEKALHIKLVTSGLRTCDLIYLCLLTTSCPIVSTSVSDF